MITNNEKRILDTVRPYNTFSEFPTNKDAREDVPVENVFYVARDTGNIYMWNLQGNPPAYVEVSAGGGGGGGIDQTARNMINAEITDRENAVNSEAATREQADNALTAYIDGKPKAYQINTQLPPGLDPVTRDWQFPLNSSNEWATNIGNLVPKAGDVVFYNKNSVRYIGIVTAVSGSSYGMVTISPVKGAFVQPPTADGTYTLQCVVSSGDFTFSWV